ncbi:endonuclease VII domain-containing protein [Nonomuraea lactucae]|uniref:endonuclease VII domain-containing protein n=1 Tax=Nonomuraea lactucae TaxID=2249762 RepID=UPI000DE2BB54
MVRFRSESNGKDPERRYRLKQYGLTLADYDRMFQAQNGVCAVCRGPQVEFRRFLDVDHCHATGRVRGLLCGTCNAALGAVNDDPELLEALAAYIQQGAPARR